MSIRSVGVLGLMLLVGGLQGCASLFSSPEPMPIVVSEPPPAATYPSECTSDTTDPAWVDPPDKEETRFSEIARIIRENKARFQAIKKDRRICGAAHRASQKPAKAKGV